MNTVHYKGQRGYLSNQQDILIEQPNGTLKHVRRSILVLGVNEGVVKVNHVWYEVYPEDNLTEDGKHIHVSNGNEAIWIHRLPKQQPVAASDQGEVDQDIADQQPIVYQRGDYVETAIMIDGDTSLIECVDKRVTKLYRIEYLSEGHNTHTVRYTYDTAVTAFHAIVDQQPITYTVKLISVSAMVMAIDADDITTALLKARANMGAWYPITWLDKLVKVNRVIVEDSLGCILYEQSRPAEQPRPMFTDQHTA